MYEVLSIRVTCSFSIFDRQAKYLIAILVSGNGEILNGFYAQLLVSCSHSFASRQQVGTWLCLVIERSLLHSSWEKPFFSSSIDSFATPLVHYANILGPTIDGSLQSIRSKRQEYRSPQFLVQTRRGVETPSNRLRTDITHDIQLIPCAASLFVRTDVHTKHDSLISLKSQKCL